MIKLNSRNRCFHCQSDIFASSLRGARNLQESVHRRDANDFSGVPTMLFTALTDVTVVLNEVDVGSQPIEHDSRRFRTSILEPGRRKRLSVSLSQY